MASWHDSMRSAAGSQPFPYGRWTALLLADTGWLWVLMLLTHEVGHGAAALLTGGEVVSADLRPGVPGHTLVTPNPHPHWVVWGGFLSGCLLPLGAWGAVRATVPKMSSDLFLLAGFCLLANGAYLAAGGGESLTDTGVLRSLGWPYPRSSQSVCCWPSRDICSVVKDWRYAWRLLALAGSAGDRSRCAGWVWRSGWRDRRRSWRRWRRNDSRSRVKPEKSSPRISRMDANWGEDWNHGDH